MAIERNRWGFNGEITFECDDCGEEIHTGEEDFQTALKVMKAEGWKSVNTNGEWHNLCPVCDDEELYEDFK